MLLPQPQAPGGLSKKVWAPFPKLVGVANGSAKRHLGGLRNDGRMIWGDLVHGVVGTISRVLLFCAVVGCIRNDGCSRTSIGPRRPPLLDAADDLIIAPGKSIGLRHRALRVL